jgi:hypothetical protein
VENTTTMGCNTKKTNEQKSIKNKKPKTYCKTLTFVELVFLFPLNSGSANKHPMYNTI